MISSFAPPRPFDPNQPEKSAPSPRINSTKPGKLVAMKAESSMRTGLSLARPMIIADMAITTEAPRRNRRTDEEIARTGSRMLTGFVRLWGTSRIVTGVRSRLKNNLSRVKPEPLSA